MASHQNQFLLLQEQAFTMMLPMQGLLQFRVDKDIRSKVTELDGLL
ncbi:hypothetical protein [Chryseobacterium glaciei]|nr:hypothetical protein [Chryseobacterium glaciei]